MYIGDLRFGLILPHFRGNIVEIGKSKENLLLPDIIIATDTYFIPVKCKSDNPDNNEIFEAINTKLNTKIRWSTQFPNGMERKYIYGNCEKLEKGLPLIKEYIHSMEEETESIVNETYELLNEGSDFKLNIGIGTKGWYYTDKYSNGYVPRNIIIKNVTNEYKTNFRMFEAVLFYSGILFYDKYHIINEKCGHVNTIRKVFDFDELIDAGFRTDKELKTKELKKRRK